MSDNSSCSSQGGVEVSTKPLKPGERINRDIIITESTLSTQSAKCTRYSDQGGMKEPEDFQEKMEVEVS